jgi:biopolymer transport protein ExbD
VRFTSKSSSRAMLVELTPMIDVVFLLIIFFMVTAEFARNVRAEVELPKLPGEQRQETEEAGIVVNIDADGRIILDVSDEPLDIGDLQVRLLEEFAAAPSERPQVLLRADRRASTTRLNEVVRLLHELGVPAARMGTEVPGGGR